MARRGRLVAVEHGDFRALFGKGLGGRGPDARAAAGDCGHLTGQRLFRPPCRKFGLLQRPQYSTSNLIFFRDRATASIDAFGIRHHLDRVLRDVGGDGLRPWTRHRGPEQADARHQNHARERIKFLF